MPHYFESCLLTEKRVKLQLGLIIYVMNYVIRLSKSTIKNNSRDELHYLTVQINYQKDTTEG